MVITKLLYGSTDELKAAGLLFDAGGFAGGIYSKVRQDDGTEHECFMPVDTFPMPAQEAFTAVATMEAAFIRLRDREPSQPQ